MTDNTPKTVTVTLSDDLIAKCEDWAAEVVARYAGSGLHAMPWSRHEMTPEQLRKWLASRKEAGKLIDIETCEIGCWYADANRDEYGIREMLGERGDSEDGYIDKFNFVRSPDSDGWVCEGDLPPAKGKAMYDRIYREHRRAMS
jgi:hypothetical protein